MPAGLKCFSISHLNFEIFRCYFRIKQNTSSIEPISRIAIFKICEQPYQKEITLKYFQSISSIIVINSFFMQELSQNTRNHSNNG